MTKTHAEFLKELELMCKKASTDYELGRSEFLRGKLYLANNILNKIEQFESELKKVEDKKE